MLIPIEGENTLIEGAKEDGAHPEISSRGLWSPFERTFYDVQVVHLFTQTHNHTQHLSSCWCRKKIKMRKSTLQVDQL